MEKESTTKDPILQKILKDLSLEKGEVFEEFRTFIASNADHLEKAHFAHDFLDLLSFKVRESRCKLDKHMLAKELYALLIETMKKFDYNTKFIAYIGKTLVTFYRNRKELDDAIIILEFLIFNGISDSDGEEFHIQLDELYHLRRKRQERGSF